MGPGRIPLEPQVHAEIEQQDEFQPGRLLRMVALVGPRFSDASRTRSRRSLWYTGDIKSGASELTATLTPTTVLTARYTVNDTPYGDIAFGPNLKHDSASLDTPARTDLFTGVASVNSGPADAIQSRRDDVSVKLNHYISGARVEPQHPARRAGGAEQEFTAGRGAGRGRVSGPEQRAVPGRVHAAQHRRVAIRRAGRLGGERDDVRAAADDYAGRPLRPDEGDRVRPRRSIDPTVSIGDGGLCKCVQSFPFTGESVPGLGDLFTWTTVAPRVGFNYKLTEDGKTCCVPRPAATIARFS